MFCKTQIYNISINTQDNLQCTKWKVIQKMQSDIQSAMQHNTKNTKFLYKILKCNSLNKEINYKIKTCKKWEWKNVKGRTILW